jgi:hypothetical protein
MQGWLKEAVTLAVKDVGDAEREVEKVMRHVALVERVFGRRVFMAVLSVANLYPRPLTHSNPSPLETASD